MTNYDYQAGSQRISNILNQKMTDEDRKKVPPESQMTYSNGYTMWVSSIFVDIRDSTKLFSNNDRDMVTRIVRSFVSEVIQILDSDTPAEIGIRGDCVYGIYSTPTKSHVHLVYEKAFYINTLMKLLNRHYSKKRYPQIKAGIGLAVSEVLVVKAGSKGSGINDRVWIGKAVSEASNLSKYGNKGGIEPIVMSESFYGNIIEIVRKGGGDDKWFKSITTNDGSVRHCNIVSTHFDNWIDNNSGL